MYYEKLKIYWGDIMRNLFEIKELDAWYSNNNPVLKKLSIQLEENSVVGLLGLNGAGKTTLINVLCGLHDGCKFSSATFYSEKTELRSNKFKKNRYVVFSEDESLGHFSFDEYLKFVFNAYGKQIDTEEVNRLVKKFNFESYRSKMIQELSTGNKRKAYLITAFALKPNLLLLDEPVNGLDFQSTEALYSEISNYRKYGTILFSSHILESVTITCDKVLILEDGHITNTFTESDITADNIRSILQFEGDDGDA